MAEGDDMAVTSEIEIEYALIEAMMSGAGAIAETVARFHERIFHDADDAKFCRENRTELLAYFAFRLRMPPEAFDDPSTIKLLQTEIRDCEARISEHVV